MMILFVPFYLLTRGTSNGTSLEISKYTFSVGEFELYDYALRGLFGQKVMVSVAIY